MFKVECSSSNIVYWSHWARASFCGVISEASAREAEALSPNPACLRFRPSPWFSSFWCYITLGWLMLAHQNRGRLSHPGSSLRMRTPSSARQCICIRAHGSSHGPGAATLMHHPFIRLHSDLCQNSERRGARADRKEEYWLLWWRSCEEERSPVGVQQSPCVPWDGLILQPQWVSDLWPLTASPSAKHWRNSAETGEYIWTCYDTLLPQPCASRYDWSGKCQYLNIGVTINSLWTVQVLHGCPKSCLKNEKLSQSVFTAQFTS